MSGHWICPKCNKISLNPELHWGHISSCNKPYIPFICARGIKREWDYSSDGKFPYYAGRPNVPNEHDKNKTPPGKIIKGYEK